MDHTMAGQPVSLAVGAAPGDPRFPRFAAGQARAMTVDLSPGDALYMPKLWRHPLDHLPVERHGILGRGQHGRVRAMVMRLLRG
ncbi:MULTISPECIES: cupin-like domain-containing protein [unclassified Sphingomonas]|uniref:cupin-like domain-containing protein n=1 Tax=unclassified Sphingomonas TaxID=196159 RepID=UPI00226AB757